MRGNETYPHSYWWPSGKDIRRPPDAKAKDDWGVSPDDGYKVVLGKGEFNRWQGWRKRRDLHQPMLDEPADKKDVKPFLDRQRQRAVEYVEREGARRRRRDRENPVTTSSDLFTPASLRSVDLLNGNSGLRGGCR